MPDSSAFAPALFRFLRDLRKNNDREWFLAHKDVYERDVKEPALAFISAFAAPLRKISPHLVADARPIGGSLFRIYRDVRFSNDKRPYKTHVGIHFRHAKAEGAHAPGLYLHLEPGDVYAAAGIWQPDGAALSGESLQRVPRGYEPDHPLASDLKRKSYIAITGMTERDACAADFSEWL